MKRKGLCLGIILLVGVLLTGCALEKPAAERVSVTWYMRDATSLHQNLKGIQAIEDAVGVDIVFQSPPEGSEDAYKMMVASGNLPDVIMWNRSSGIDRMIEEGSAIELTSLIAQYAPNLTHIYQQRPEIRREAATPDGRLYFFPSISPMLTEDEICRKCYNGLIVRQDWLEKLGIAPPETIDDWYDMLVAFKTRDPNGNGLADEIPFDGWGLPLFAPVFGVLNGFCVKTDGTVVFGPMEQEYKAFLETMNKWYAEGLIGSNSILQSEVWKTANITNDIAGSFYGLDNAWRYYLPSLREKTPDAQLLAVGWPKDAQDVRYTPRADAATHLGDVITIITSACKNPEAAVRLIDYMYSTAGGNYLGWGIEGETYEVVDGRKRLLPEALEMEEDGYLKLYHYAIAHIQWPKYEGETAVLQTYPEDQLVAERTWADASTALIYPPAVRLSTEDNVRCNDIMNRIQSYFEEMQIRFITGEEPLSNFDAFVENLKRMGIEEVLAVYRKQYAEYQAK